MESPRLVLENVRKTFGSGSRAVEVLRDVSLTLHAGESLAVTGPSGSGKSTLLHLIGALDRPTSGSIRIAGETPLDLPEPALARFRNRSVGFVFQHHHLLPQYSALENVLIPTIPFKRRDENPEQRATELLRRVGMSQRLDHLPSELSGGERQRVAVARALVNRPGLLLCDEPTGSLDHATAETVTRLLFELHETERTTLIVVTHNPELAERCQRRAKLEAGTCVEV